MLAMGDIWAVRLDASVLVLFKPARGASKKVSRSLCDRTSETGVFPVPITVTGRDMKREGAPMFVK